MNRLQRLSCWPALLIAGCSIAETAPPEALPAPTTPPASTQPAERNADPLVFADTLWLDNGTVKLGVSPSVGRITWFGYADGENLLWVNPETVNTPPDGDPDQWINYGGDKVWPSPQPLWKFFYPHKSNWPPDGQIDGEAWDVVSQRDDQIVIRSPRSPQFGGSVKRQIRIRTESSDDGRLRAGVVRIVNTLQRTDRSALPAQAWSVTQTVLPDQVVLIDQSEGRLPDGYLPMAHPQKFEGELDVEDGAVHWVPTVENPRPHKKLGALGAVIAARFGDDLLVQTQEFSPDATYPEHTSTQLYVADKYIELETLSPIATLEPGDSLEHEVVWHLLPVADLPAFHRLSERLDPSAD